MCGICGFLNRNGEPADVGIVRRMNETLWHRGPDDSGESVRGRVALGHRRLSIIDVARGRQPMTLEGSPYEIVYNGEVYNHQELRGELGRSPETYRTHCDTETVLAAYSQLGAASVSHLRGMFAFAIHDRENGSLFLARDRLGIKPLYYYLSDELFAFASEIKALLAHPAIEARVNSRKLPVQLALKYTLDDETLFEGIRKLAPGHTLLISGDRVHSEPYWALSFEPKERFSSLDEAAAGFREVFEDSVRSRLMSDVPLGVFLSGGIDSSAIAMSMGSMVSEPIRTFSVSFAEAQYNEFDYARQVAEKMVSRHREILLEPEQWFSAWPAMVFHEDEPIAHPSSISLHYLSKLAAEDVKVVLTGEGADELMAGYERYYQTLINLRYGKLVPHGVRALASRCIDALPDTWIAKRKATRTAIYLDADIESLFLDNYAAFPRSSLMTALRPQFRSTVMDGMYAPFRRLMDASDAENLLEQILYADIKTYLLELLMKQDQMSMSASIESRVPFLDHRLVEAVCRMPAEFKLKGFQTKRVLRRALGHTLPPQIVTRKKMGFPTPTREWFRGPYRLAMQRLLLGPRTLSTEFVEPEYVRRMLEAHAAGSRDLEEQIWTLANLELWLRIFIDGQAPDQAWRREMG